MNQITQSSLELDMDERGETHQAKTNASFYKQNLEYQTQTLFTAAGIG